MAKKALISEARLRTIYARQNIPLWGPDYIPAQLATREEAPSISRASIVYSSRLRRDVHFLSLPERAAGSLALLHPRLVDLHEQKALSPIPAPPPLTTPPRAQGQVFPPLPGTLAIAERLGIANRHPRVWIDDPQSIHGERAAVPFPYLGDLLLVMEDRDGLYCINWSVKKTVAAFSSPIGNRVRARASREHAAERVAQRQTLEAEYYAAAGIRTVQVSEADMDLMLVTNLKWLITWSARPVPTDPEKRQAVWAAFRTLRRNAVSPRSVFPELQTRLELSQHECKRLFYEGIYRRDIRVDLYSPILIDRALRPERQDPLVEFSRWFAR